MVKNLKVYYITLLVLALGVLSVLSLSGCQTAPTATGTFVSAKGVNVEAMMVPESMMMMKAGTKDVAQMDALKALNAYFPNDPMLAISKEISKGMKEDSSLKEQGLDYEKDLLPMINSKSEFYVSMGLKAGATDLKDPEAVIALTLADEGKFDALMKLQADKGNLQKEDYNGVALYLEKKSGDVVQSVFGRIDDVAFLANSKTSAQRIVDAVKNKKNLLGEQAAYKKAMAKIKPGLAIAYIDVAKMMQMMEKSAGQNADAQKFTELMKMTGVQQEMINSIESEAFSVSAEKDGLMMTVLISAKDGSDFTKSIPKTASVYLAKKIPAVNPAMYMESSDMKTSYQMLMTSLMADESGKSGVEEMKKALQSAGLDLDKDILAFLDKNYAFMIDDDGSVIPRIGFYVDASSNAEGAIKVAKKIDAFVDQALASMKNESPEMVNFVSKEEVNKGQMWKIKVNLDSLLLQAPPALVKKLTGQKIELYYGVNNDKVLLIALHPDLNDSWGKGNSVLSSGEMKKAVGYLNGADKGLTYLAPSQVISWSDRLMTLVADIGSQVDTTDYDLVKKYIVPVKSVTMGAYDVEKTQMKAVMFMHIAQ